jgi:hypothetical protein
MRGARVVNAGVSRENELRHMFNALFLESRDDVQKITSAAP